MVFFRFFELTNEKVWAYASQDTVGLQQYYEEHKDEFMWGNRLDASIYTVNDSAYVNTIREMLTAGKSEEEVKAEIFNDSLRIVRVEHKKFQKGENDLIDSIKWKKGLTDNQEKAGKR